MTERERADPLPLRWLGYAFCLIRGHGFPAWGTGVNGPRRACRKCGSWWQISIGPEVGP